MLRFLLLVGFVILVGLAAYTQWQAWRIAAAYPPTGKFVEIAGGRLHYTERQPAGAQRETVLLLHGASGNEADMMMALGDRLAAQGFHVLAFDRPGHGWSQRPDGRAAAAPDMQARLVQEGVEALGVTEAIVVAHSLAGAMATNLAINRKSFVAGLVLVSPVTHPWPGGIAWYYTVASTPVVEQVFTRLIALPLGKLLLDKGVEAVFAPNSPPAGYVEKTRIELLFRPDDFIANAQDVAALHAFVTRQAPRLGEIEAPTAIVTGDIDGIVSPQIHSAASARVIRGATLTVLKGAGHAVQWTNPQAVIDAVLDVAKRIETIRRPAAAQ
jgi:pimeloyl-ACP methyl ester carboxylesterase